DPEGHAVVGATVDVEGIRRGIRGLYGAVKDADPLAVTDTNGDFFLATADSAAALMVRVSARGLAPRYFDEVPIGPVPSTLRLSRGGTLSGRVLRDGRPVAGVVVAVTAEGGYFMDFSRDTIATGRDGTFSFVN